jgi:hypothetical protein
MKRHHLWFAASSAVIPFVVFACGGGRSDIDLLLEAAAGGAGAAGQAGGAGAGGAKAGAAGQTSVCSPGEAIECACPGTPIKGVQVCSVDGTGFKACQGCPGGSGGSNQGGNGGSNQAGSNQAGSNQAGSNQGGSGGSNQGGNPSDAGSDFFDALPFPLPDSGPVGECIGCLQENCNDSINGCYNDPSCVDGIQCAITDCFASSALGGGQGAGGQGGPGGGGLDFGCLLGCFNGDPTAVFAAVQAFQCITQTCGEKCGGGILGDGGGFPLGGLGGGPTPNAQPSPDALRMQGVRVPRPEEVPGFPRLQQALTPGRGR